MAPPRITKKASLTTVSQTTSRQGLQQSRKQVVEETEELDEFDDTNSMDIDGEAQEEELEESQNITSDPLQQLMANMVDDQRKRYAARKKGVHETYNKSYKTARESIDGFFDEHEEKASSAHQAQLKRLQELLAQKAKIEDTMAKKLASLQAEYAAHSRDLERVVDRRMKELK